MKNGQGGVLEGSHQAPNRVSMVSEIVGVQTVGATLRAPFRAGITKVRSVSYKKGFHRMVTIELVLVDESIRS